MAGPTFRELRRRLRRAEREGALNPQKRLGARTLAAMGDLLKAQYLAEASALLWKNILGMEQYSTSQAQALEAPWFLTLQVHGSGLPL